MFSQIDRLDYLLEKLSEGLEQSKNRRFTANQALRAERIHLEEGATLNITMNNMIFSADAVDECRRIVGELKHILPRQNGIGIDTALENYKDILITRALEAAEWNQTRAAELAGINRSTLAMWISKKKPGLQKRKLLSEK